ncbi:hypothetical protein AHF37_03143 [Paragonimus kellicotti]|nr:hypothetical protein AHF37_03143 [Paragonimus kellicotti]
MSGDSIDSKPMRISDMATSLEGGLLTLSKEEVCDPNLYYPICPSDVSKRIYRGHCLLINQRDFSPATGQGRRDGTDVDADRVERLFKRLGYIVRRHLNVNRSDMRRILREVASFDHRQCDSFVCFILSHGENGVVYSTDGPVQMDEIISVFRGSASPTLIGKPKLFFVQACRGSEFDKGATLPMTTDAAPDVIVTRLPVEADILVAHSTVPGFFAWRNSLAGSWFIQELCRTLEEDSARVQPSDIASLLTVVARCVAYQYRSNTNQPGSHDMLQMTNYTSTLTRLAYLTGKPNNR